jgi:hypothetical protein
MFAPALTTTQFPIGSLSFGMSFFAEGFLEVFLAFDFVPEEEEGFPLTKLLDSLVDFKFGL